MGLLRRAVNAVKSVAKPIAGAALGFSPITALPSTTGVFGQEAKDAGNLFISGATALASGSAGGFLNANTSSNNSTWYDRALDAFLKDRDRNLTQKGREKELEILERSKTREENFILERERQRLFSGQAGGAYNPPPGGLSNKPSADNAENKRIDDKNKDKDKILSWLLPVAVGVFSLIAIPLLVKR